MCNELLPWLASFLDFITWNVLFLLPNIFTSKIFLNFRLITFILFRKTLFDDRRSLDRHENSKSQMPQNGVWSVIFRKLALKCPHNSHVSVHFISLIYFFAIFVVYKITSELYSHIVLTQPHAFFRQFAGVICI